MGYSKPMPYLVDALEAARSRARQTKREYARLKRRKAMAAAKAASKAIAQAKAGAKPKKAKPKQIEYNNDPPKYVKGMGKEFYQTREWRKVRYAAIVQYGKICACCGAEAYPLHVDHVKPRSKYPSLELDIGNLQVLCADCNLGKSNTYQTDWRGASTRRRESTL